MQCEAAQVFEQLEEVSAGGPGWGGEGLSSGRWGLSRALARSPGLEGRLSLGRHVGAV